MSISADNITAHSMLLADNVPPPPAVETLLDELRRDLARQEREALEKAAAHANDARLSARFNRTAARARNNAEKLERLLLKVPDGFRLVALWYEPVPDIRSAGGEKEDPVLKEYSGSLVDNFLKRAATVATAALKKMGICAHGIRLMAQGWTPVDAHGKPYKVSVDHKIPRKGAGVMARETAPDPARPHDPKKRFLVNHQSNLILMQDSVHEYKNALEMIQMPAKNRRARFIVTIAPVDDGAHSTMVALPQETGVEFRGHKPSRCIARARHHMKKALGTVRLLKKKSQPSRRLLAGLRKAARQQGGAKVAALAAREPSLCDEFNKRVRRRDPAAAHLIDAYLRPGLSDLADSLAHVFEEAAEARYAAGDGLIFRKFRDLYHSRNMQSLRTAVAGLPLPEAARLHATFNDITPRLAAISAARKKARRRHVARRTGMQGAN